MLIDRWLLVMLLTVMCVQVAPVLADATINAELAQQRKLAQQYQDVLKLKQQQLQEMNDKMAKQNAELEAFEKALNAQVVEQGRLQQQRLSAEAQR